MIILSLAYRWPLICFANDDKSFLLKISLSSSTDNTWSGFDRFGTCKTDVNAEIISMSSSTCLRNYWSDEWNIILYYTIIFIQMKIFTFDCLCKESIVFGPSVVVSSTEQATLAKPNLSIVDQLNRSQVAVQRYQRGCNSIESDKHHQRSFEFEDISPIRWIQPYRLESKFWWMENRT